MYTLVCSVGFGLLLALLGPTKRTNVEPGREGSNQGLKWAELPWSLSLLPQLHCFQEVKALLALLGSDSWQCLVHCIVLEMDCGWVSLCRANPPPEEMPWCEGNSETVRWGLG